MQTEKHGMVMYKDGGENFGLILTGGGARGAYQVGVLKAVAEISKSKKVAFPVISGVSVGAINAVGLASRFSNFKRSVECMETFWMALRTDHVFDVRFRKIALTGLRMIISELLPAIFKKAPNSLLNTEPLRQCLARNIDLESMSRAIDEKDLSAVSVTCSGYSSGHAVTFFQSKPNKKNWHRVRRDGVRQKLTLDHVMASSALPFLFPAVQIGEEFYGDGALRLNSPLAPAIHLDASRLLIIGTRDELGPVAPPEGSAPQHPTIGDIGGYALDTLFNDSLEADIERLERINKTLGRIPTEQRAAMKMQQIDFLTINPSKDLPQLALEHVNEMPRALRWILRRKKSVQNNGRLESYLLFEPGYVGSLIELGYQDAKAKAAEIRAFLGGTEKSGEIAA